MANPLAPAPRSNGPTTRKRAPTTPTPSSTPGEPDWSAAESVTAQAEPDWSKAESVKPARVDPEPDWSSAESYRFPTPELQGQSEPAPPPRDESGTSGGVFGAAMEQLGVNDWLENSGVNRWMDEATGAIKRGGQSMVRSALGMELFAKGRALEQVRSGIAPEVLDVDPAARARLKAAYQDYFDTLGKIEASESLSRETTKGKGTKAIEAISADPNLATLEKGAAYLRALKSDPLGVVRDITLENGPMMLEMVVAGLLTGGTGSAALAAGSAGGVSAANEFSNRYVDLRGRGLDHESAWQQAGVASGIIATMDAVSFRAAGKAFDKLAKDGLVEKLATAARGTAEQAVLGAGGEANAQLALEAMNRGTPLAGQFFDPIDIGQEAVGEVAGVFTEGAANPRTRLPGEVPQPIPPQAEGEIPPVEGAPVEPPITPVQPTDISGQQAFGSVEPAAGAATVEAGGTVPAVGAIEPIIDTGEPQMVEPTIEPVVEPELGLEPITEPAPEAPVSGPAPGASPDGAIQPTEEVAPQPSVPATGSSGAEPLTSDADAAAARAKLREKLGKKPVEADVPANPLTDQDKADLESVRHLFTWDEKGGKLLRNEETGQPIGRTKFLGPDIWAERPRAGAARPGQPQGRYELGEKQARQAVDKALKGERITPAEQRFIDHALRHMRGEEPYQQDGYEPPAVTPDDFKDALLDSKDPANNEFADLIREASKHGTDEEIETALDTQSDDLARERLRAIIQRGESNAPAAPTSTPQEPAGQEPEAVPAPAQGAAGEGQAAQPATVDEAAHAAATSPKNDLPTPTEAQREAGNYAKGHVRLAGFDIAIENPEGSERTGTDSSGKAWRVKMPAHYGYIKGTVGKDKDHVDVWVKPGATDESVGKAPVFIVDQYKANGQLDEHKVFFGWADSRDAVDTYTNAYQTKTLANSLRRNREPVQMTMDEFREWLKSGDQARPASEAVVDRHIAEGPESEPSNADVVPGRGNAGLVDYEAGLERAGWKRKDRDWVKGDRSLFLRGQGESSAAIVQWKVDNSQAEVVNPAPTAEPRKIEVSANVLVTEDAAAAARELLRKKLRNINSGIDPEVLQAALQISAYHIERGARTFAAYARAMLDDLSDLADEIRPYLKSWYLATKFDPRYARVAAEMDSAADVEKASLEEKAAAAPAAPAPTPTREDGVLAMFRGLLRSKNQLADYRRLYMVETGEKLDGPALKRVDELIELAIVKAAREIAASDRTELEKFDELVALYGRQPNLSTRTSTSIENQAYSTPAPLAYLASRIAGIDKDTFVYEPTAGNGMLLIEASPENTHAVELNEDRAASLRALGFKPVVGNTLARDNQPDHKQDVVIANPPFGVVRGDKGRPITHQVVLEGMSNLVTNEIDHAISLEALKFLKPNGRAVLILGGVNKQLSGDARAKAYEGQAKKDFFYRLYKRYGVTQHFTVAGELYAKQGAAWPVDVLVIEGTQPSALPPPFTQLPRVYASWRELRDLIPGSVQPAAQPDAPNAGADVGVGNAEPAPVEDGAPGAAGRPAAEPAPVVQGPGASPEPAVPGPRGAGPVEGGPPAAPAGDARPGDGQPAAGGEARRPRRPAGPVSEGPAGGAKQLGAASADRGADGAGAVAPPVVRNAPDVTPTDSQVPYEPQSAGGTSVGTLLPVNMRSAVQAALINLEGRVGPLDDYVATELKWTKAQTLSRLSAEQIDAVAMAVEQIKGGRGFVIGDQTGVGKGRVVAAVIRWALLNDLIPQFFTEKPNLYVDIYRDLIDIQQDDIRPLLTNASANIALDADGAQRIRTRPAKEHNALLSGLADAASLGDYNMVFSTYSQMQGEAGDNRRRFALALAPRSVVIVDESHNAGGQDAGRKSKRETDADGGNRKEGRAGFFRQLIQVAKGVFYSSATYAKRPEVMDLYSATDMKLAVEGDVNKLPAAIQRGGVPLQQVVASMLAKAGQYIRRERSFAGVEYRTPVVPVDMRIAESMARVMARIVEFDTRKKAIVKDIKDTLNDHWSTISGDTSEIGAPSVGSTNFTSIMHNLIDQSLLSMKMKPALEKALEALAAGQKPVITVANTMGSFIEDYAEQQEINPGDVMKLSFKALLQAYLDKSRTIRVKAGGEKVPVRTYLTDEQLGPSLLAMYKEIERMIAQADILDTIPVSPIDWLHWQLGLKGYKAGEITGRTHALDYADGIEKPRYRLRPQKEKSVDGKTAMIRDFNNGKLDVMILNQSGSTGLSLHASEKFKDQRRRRMIIAQPERNIDTHMQMLGRVHRTGQVITPEYDQLVADIPAEKRPAAVLAKKMASLNANTTASRTSALTSKDVVDFLNVYGDEVVAQMMDDMPELHTQLGEPLKRNEDAGGYERLDAARKVTGRLPLITDVEEQARIYDMIEEGYREAVARADAAGENILEAKTIDFQAKPIARAVLFEGDPANPSPFASSAHLEIMEVKRQGKPYTWQEVQDMVVAATESPTYEPVQHRNGRVLRDFEIHLEAERDRLEGMAEREAEAEAEAEGQKSKKIDVAGRLAVLEDVRDRWLEKSNLMQIGETVSIGTGTGDTLYGVVISVQQKKGIKLPVALGSWSATIAIADGARRITIPFSRFRTMESARKNEEGMPRIGAFSRSAPTELGDTVPELFEKGQTVSRENRVFVTGNMLAGFTKVRGIITNFTDNRGAIHQGILLPRTFDLKDFNEDQPVEFDDAGAILRFLRGTKTALVRSTDGNVQIQRLGDDWLVATPKSKADGGRYFLDAGLRRILGDFTSSGSFMRARTWSEQRVGDAIRYLQNEMGVTFRTDSYKDEAVKAGGKRMAGEMKAVKDTGGGNAEDLGLDLAESPTMRKVLPDKAMDEHVAKLYRGATFRHAIIDPNNPPAAHADLMKRLRKRGLHRRVKGAIDRDPATGELVVVLMRGRFESLHDLEMTALHEASHFGFYSLFGRDYLEFTTKVYNSQGRSTFKPKIERYFGKVTADGTIDTGAFDQNDPTHRMRVVDEMLADLGGQLAADQTLGGRMRAVWDRLIGWLQDRLMARGFRTRYSQAQLRNIARRALGAAFKAGTQAFAQSAQAFEGETGLALEEEDRNARAAHGWFVNAIRNGQPVDKAFRMIATPLGLGSVKDSRYHASRWVMDGIRRGVAQAQRAIDSGRFPWLQPTLARGKAAGEHLLAGFVDRYNTPAEFLAREAARDTGIRVRDAAAVKLGRDLQAILSGPEEVQMLQAALTGEEIDNETITRLAAPIIAAIDDMGQELVALGQLSRESYERNRKKYLHRMYEKYEYEEFGLGAWAKVRKAVHNFADSRRSRIQGDIFKGRGIFWKVNISSLKKAVGPDWWGWRFEKGKIDVRLGDTKWRVLDKVEVSGPSEAQPEMIFGGKQRTRVVDRVYWPADEPIPRRFAGYDERGVFEVREVRPGEVTLWRDYTAAERRRMGEILDSRYTVVKTFMLMARDLETGRFFADIAANEEWTRKEAPLDANGKEDYEEARNLRRHSAYVGVRWVKVPDTVIPKTGGVRRYGALAGKFVKAEIWRDLAEYEAMKLPSLWRSILRTWKTFKTAYTPTVHFNNVISNFMLADLMDVTWTDLMDGLKSFLEKDANYTDAYNHGLFSGTYTGEEIKREYLEPLLKQLQAEAEDTRETVGALTFFNRTRRFIAGVPGLMRNAYEFEDSIFRMGAYLKLLREGETPNVAAFKARRQFIDYDIRAPYINFLRSTILPFVSYPYRLAPLLAEAVSNRPYKILKYATLGYLLANAYAWFSGDDDDDDRRFLNPELAGHTWFGAPQAIRVGTDQYGNPIYWDVRRLVPGGDLFELGGSSPVPWLPATMVPGGPLVLAAEVVPFNKTLFTTKPVTDYTNESATENMQDIALHLYRGWAPNVPGVPFTWATKRVTDAMKGTVTDLGQERSVGMAVASSFGIKLTAQNLQENITRRRREVDIANRDIRARLTALERRYRRERSSMTLEDYVAERDELLARIRRNEEQWRELDPGGALRDARR